MMGLEENEALAVDEAENNLSLIERRSPCHYLECRKLFEDLILAAEDLEADRHDENVAAFEFCLNRWNNRVETCLNRHNQRGR